CVLAYFLIKRRDLPFPRTFWLFAAFIFACGTVHLVEAGIFWWPAYRLSGTVKLATAVVSWVTVLALIPVIPQAINLPRIVRLNDRLQTEVDQRKAAEAQLRRVNQSLQQDVESKSGELSRHEQHLQLAQ